LLEECDRLVVHNPLRRFFFRSGSGLLFLCHVFGFM
jgi:hypothetical protein